MKKLLLTGAALMALSFGAKAQSFETSEGYSAGNVNGQNGWITTSYTVEEGGETMYIENQVINNEFASQGANSLKIATEADFGPQQNPVIGAFHVASTTGETWTVSYDIYIVPDPEVAEGNDYTFNLYGQNEDTSGFTSRVAFRFDNSISVVDFDEEGELSYMPLDLEWEAETWYHVEIAVSNGNVTYTINDDVLYEGTALDSTFDTLAVTIDNYGGDAYVDNIVITGGSLSTPQAVANSFSVSPNPANNVVTITNADNVLVNNVSLTDLNGRIVKTASFDGVAQAQVNVSDLANGVYMMTISSDKGSVTKKIVKN